MRDGEWRALEPKLVGLYTVQSGGRSNVSTFKKINKLENHSNLQYSEDIYENLCGLRGTSTRRTKKWQKWYFNTLFGL